MIELNDGDQLKTAIKRAQSKDKNMLVQMTSINREFRVVNRRNGYSFIVNFLTHQDGRRFGHCNCASGSLDMLCIHICLAIRLNESFTQRDLLNLQTEKAN